MQAHRPKGHAAHHASTLMTKIPNLPRSRCCGVQVGMRMVNGIVRLEPLAADQRALTGADVLYRCRHLPVPCGLESGIKPRSHQWAEKT
jgi:hypothetical protein